MMWPQVLISANVLCQLTPADLDAAKVVLLHMGEHTLKGSEASEALYQVCWLDGRPATACTAGLACIGGRQAGIHCACPAPHSYHRALQTLKACCACACACVHEAPIGIPKAIKGRGRRVVASMAAMALQQKRAHAV